MNEAEVKSRLESWRWSLEEEKTFTELIAWAAMEKASVPILRSCRNLDKYIAYMQLKKAACRQSREEHKRLLDLVTDDAARQVLYMRYEQGCTAERTAELLCYSVSMIYRLQRKGITEISVALNSERAVKECRNAIP